jgi:hypothetical protein
MYIFFFPRFSCLRSYIMVCICESFLFYHPPIKWQPTRVMGTSYVVVVLFQEINYLNYRNRAAGVVRWQKLRKFVECRDGAENKSLAFTWERAHNLTQRERKS